MESDKKMLEMWKKISVTYWKAKDLEEKQRILLSNFLWDKKGDVLELWCWNWKILWKIKNNNLNLYWLDYSAEMISQAKNDYKWIEFLNGDILDLDKSIWNKKFDFVFSVNTLHNLPNKALIQITFDKMLSLTKEGGYVIFDIRNMFNPFINLGYYKNRKKWLNFWTLNPFTAIKYFKKNNFEIILNKWVHYTNVEDSLFDTNNRLLIFLYSIYLKITSIRIFSPYIFIILRKK